MALQFTSNNRATLIALGSPRTFLTDERTITAAGDVTVAASDYLIRLNKTVPATTNVILPASSTRTANLFIKDIAGNADSYHFALIPHGSEDVDGVTAAAGGYVGTRVYESIELHPRQNGTGWDVTTLIGNATVSSPLIVSANSNSVIGAVVANLSTGASAAGAWGLSNSTAALGNFAMASANYTAVPLLQNRVFVNASGGSGLAFLTNDAQPIVFATNLTERGNISSAGQWNITGGPLSIVANSNTVIGAAVNNTSSGTSAAAAWGVASGSALGNFGITASTYTAFPLLTSRTFINASGGSGIAILTNDAQPIVFATNNTYRGGFDATGPLLVGPTTLVPQNSAILFSINRNTAAPVQKPTGTVVDWIMQIQGANNEKPGVTIDSFGAGTTSVFSVLTFRRANGTSATPSALQSGDLVGVLGGIGYGTTTFSLDQWQIRYYAAQTWTDTAWGTSMAFLTTPNGSTTVTEAMRIDQTQFVGIGTNAPQSRLHVSANTTQNSAALTGTLLQLTAADTVSAAALFSGFGAGVTGGPGVVLSHAGGTAGSPSQTANATLLGYVGARAYTNSSAYTAVGVQIAFNTAEAQTATAQGKNIDIFTTPTGSTTPAVAVRVQASGGISVGTTSDPGLGMIYTNAATFMNRSKTAWSNGAAASTGTLTNAPAATNPTKWIPVDDNGTTRYIPAW